MFKENYLIFETGEPKRTPTTGEKMGPIKKATNKVIKDYMELFENAKNREKIFVPRYLKSMNKAWEIMGAMQQYAALKIRDGYEYGGFGYGGIEWIWHKEGKTHREINPAFHYKKYQKAFTPECKRLIAKRAQAIERAKEIEDIRQEAIDIVKKLQEKGSIRKDLPEAIIIKSDLYKEILEVININFQYRKKSKPDLYSLESSGGKKFRFKLTSSTLKAIGYKDLGFDLSKYHSGNLNHKKVEGKYTPQKEHVLPPAKHQYKGIDDNERDSKADRDFIGAFPKYNAESRAVILHGLGKRMRGENQDPDSMEKTIDFGYELLEVYGEINPKVTARIETIMTSLGDLEDFLKDEEFSNMAEAVYAFSEEYPECVLDGIPHTSGKIGKDITKLSLAIFGAIISSQGYDFELN